MITITSNDLSSLVNELSKALIKFSNDKLENSQAKRIAEIESVVNSSVIYKILELLKNINTQLGVLEYHTQKDKNLCQEQ